jgi:hypothetical protein
MQYFSNCDELYWTRWLQVSFINPNSGVTMDELADCQQAMINYTVKNDAASYCMKGQIADITCFSVVKKGEPVKPKNEF